jgi:cation diffusion facilitator CzcD-associated flavoprotein CzcO
MGKRDISLHERFKPHPVTYLALCVDEFPNFFLIGGPNIATTSSSYMALLDKKVMYAVEATKKLQRERLKSMVVKKDAVKDFDEYIEVRHLRNAQISGLTHSRPTSLRSVLGYTWSCMITNRLM